MGFSCKSYTNSSRFLVARDSFKLSFKLFSVSVNLLLRNSLTAVETAAFFSLFDSIPESSDFFRSYVMYMLCLLRLCWCTSRNTSLSRECLFRFRFLKVFLHRVSLIFCFIAVLVWCLSVYVSSWKKARAYAVLVWFCWACSWVKNKNIALSWTMCCTS